MPRASGSSILTPESLTTTVDASVALADLTLDITEAIRIHAPIADGFEALLEELDPANVGRAGQPMPMVLEARPGGRCYRGLGNDNGHLCGHEVMTMPRLQCCRAVRLTHWDHCRCASANGTCRCLQSMDRAPTRTRSLRSEQTVSGSGAWCERSRESATPPDQ